MDQRKRNIFIDYFWPPLDSRASPDAKKYHACSFSLNMDWIAFCFRLRLSPAGRANPRNPLQFPSRRCGEGGKQPRHEVVQALPSICSFILLYFRSGDAGGMDRDKGLVGIGILPTLWIASGCSRRGRTPIQAWLYAFASRRRSRPLPAQSVFSQCGQR